ncbi:MAG: cytochrome c [Candidatus Methylacidiphilales bacterium]|nr:cytochrome c [Candidatus Methylacidiphilales bacterium]
MQLSPRILLTVICAGTVLAACKDAPPNPRESAESVALESLLAEGEETYNQTCAMCHLDGHGSEVVPPLIGAPALSKDDPAELIGIILNGQKGKIERGGKTFDGIMPPHGYLSDREIAAVATYLRKTYGSHPAPVQPTQVAKLR